MSLAKSAHRNRTAVGPLWGHYLPSTTSKKERRLVAVGHFKAAFPDSANRDLRRYEARRFFER
jgi:hypothetical protein